MAFLKHIDPGDLAGANRPVLVTGCSSGIGYCAVETLSRRGYRVFATARSEEDVARLIGEGYTACRLDLASSSSIAEACEWMLDLTQGHIYALFNNAAYGQPGAVEDLTRDCLREQFECNVFGTQELTNRIIPAMRRLNQGRIIYNSSILGLVCMPYRGAYNASKYAIEALADTLRLELRGSGIHVSLIEPGPIHTAFRSNAVRQFQQRVAADSSVHSASYRSLLKQFAGDESVRVPFAQGPEAVVKRLVSILESRHPEARYPVTFPAYLLKALKRILPDSALDALMSRVD
ncbi:MAG: hypothetical protein RIQ52_1539 [Pseudomonadota bacterium]|jgi:NAD(P)-dependent dehydrogenase (short-subunit alcohol dehydrogenase family)